MNDNNKKVPALFLATGVIAVSLYAVGTMMNPDRTMNNWKLAGTIVGGVGIITMLIMVMIRKKKG